MTKTVRENDLFAFVGFQPVEYWRILLFKDRYNFGGIKESSPESVAFSWDVASHLPEGVRGAFRLTVAELLFKVYRYNDKRRIEVQNTATTQEEYTAPA